MSNRSASEFQPGVFVKPRRGDRLGVVVKHPALTGIPWVCWADDGEWFAPVPAMALRETKETPPVEFLARLLALYRAEIFEHHPVRLALRRAVHRLRFRARLTLVSPAGAGV